MNPDTYNTNLTTLIFDLSETLIAGLLGVEKSLSPILRVDEQTVLSAFAGQHLHGIHWHTFRSFCECRGTLVRDRLARGSLARRSIFDLTRGYR